MAENRLDDLLLLEKLAAGGMAEVYRAIQQGYGGFEKTVAVKRILPHYASDDEFKNMFVMEANLSGLLQHPNVVQIFSNGESDGYLYLVMEFVDGKNMRQLLARADKLKIRIPTEFACFMVAEAAKGLDYAHSFVDQKTGQSMDIVHRDMSPQNVMLSYDGAIKIVDFGIAKAAARSEHTRAGVLKGKFGYMSPEQAQGMPIDKRSDIFALGIIFFELLTQRRLFSHDDDMRTLQLIRECNVPRPSKYNPAISPALDRIVLKALAKNRNDRYATANELYADIQRFLNQKYPNFLPMDFAKFLRERIFVEDIENEKKKRETMAADAPARLSSPKSKKKVETPLSASEANKRDKDATQFDFNDELSEITQISEVGFAEPHNIASESIGLSQEESSSVELSMESLSEAPPSAPVQTRILQEEEEKLPPPVLEDEDKAAFAMNAGPSHLSLSLTAGGGPLPSVSKLKAPSKTAPLPQEMVLEDVKQESKIRLGGKTIDVSHRERPRIFSNRSYVLLMVAAGLGAYSHFSSQESSQTNVKTEVAKIAEQSLDVAKSAVAEIRQEASGRQPASVEPIKEEVYVAEGAKGYLVVESPTLLSANKAYVNGKLLLDNQGRPAKDLTQPMAVSVGRHSVRIENVGFGLVWEGEIDIEFDTVKKLPIQWK